MTPPDSGEYLRARTIRNVENPMGKPASDAREVCGAPIVCDMRHGHDGMHSAALVYLPLPLAQRILAALEENHPNLAAELRERLPK